MQLDQALLLVHHIKAPVEEQQELQFRDQQTQIDNKEQNSHQHQDRMKSMHNRSKLELPSLLWH